MTSGDHQPLSGCHCIARALPKVDLLKCGTAVDLLDKKSSGFGSDFDGSYLASRVAHGRLKLRRPFVYESIAEVSRDVAKRESRNYADWHSCLNLMLLLIAGIVVAIDRNVQHTSLRGLAGVGFGKSFDLRLRVVVASCGSVSVGCDDVVANLSSWLLSLLTMENENLLNRRWRVLSAVDCNRLNSGWHLG